MTGDPDRTPDLAELRRLAEAATPEPWAVDRSGWITAGRAIICVQSLGHPKEPNGAYISAANPVAIVALLDRLASAEAALKLLIEELDDLGRRVPVCYWDSWLQRHVHDPKTHAISLSLALEKKVRAHFAKWEKPDATAQP